MDIALEDDKPVQRAYVSIPPPMFAEVKAYLDDMKRRGWIRPSKSPYSSSMVCVRKKDGSLRLCIDYRQINQNTIKDSHPIPRIQDTLNVLGGKTWFSTLDQGKAYHAPGIHQGGSPPPHRVRDALGTGAGYLSAFLGHPRSISGIRKRL
jgi:hypothetical protein